jgi:hypothetical protein
MLRGRLALYMAMHPRYSVSEQLVASRARALFSRLHSPLSDR